MKLKSSWSRNLPTNSRALQPPINIQRFFYSANYPTGRVCNQNPALRKSAFKFHDNFSSSPLQLAKWPTFAAQFSVVIAWLLCITDDLWHSLFSHDIINHAIKEQLILDGFFRANQKPQNSFAIQKYAALSFLSRQPMYFSWYLRQGT